MKKIIQYGILAMAISFLFIITSCHKENKCVAGTGGSVEVVVKLYHHGRLIPNDSLKPDTVWAKFNVTEWKNAPSGYDMMAIGEAGEDHIHLKDLRCGDYFLHAAGWDTTGPYVVTGGLNPTIHESTGEVGVDVPVSE